MIPSSDPLAGVGSEGPADEAGGGTPSAAWQRLLDAEADGIDLTLHLAETGGKSWIEIDPAGAPHIREAPER